MNSQTLTAMNGYLRIAFIIICMVILCIPAFAFTYEIDEMVVPWGTEPGQVYTDYYSFDPFWEPQDFPLYTTAWDIYENTAYIIDQEPETYGISLIQYNFDTGQIIEEDIGVTLTPDTLKVLASEDEYFLVESYLMGYTCYDYNFNILWDLLLPEVEETCFAYSDLYKLNDNLWGVVVKFSDAVPPRYELWKMTATEEIISREPLQLPTEDSRVVSISPEGEITWSPFVDMYGGVYGYNDQGNFERKEGDQVLEFPIAPSPEGFWLGPDPAKPFYDGTVYTFEYTEDGIRLRRYTLLPESATLPSPEPGSP